MAGQEIGGEIQSSVGENGGVSREVCSVKYVCHIDESNIFVLPTKREEVHTNLCKTTYASLCAGDETLIPLLICYAHYPSVICIHVSFHFTLEKNGEHGPHSPQLAWVHSSSASRRRPCYKAPMKKNSQKVRKRQSSLILRNDIFS